MGLIRREVPFGENEKESRRSLYKIDDPFFRLWFRVVAPHRALLTAGSEESRKELLARYWEELNAQAFEELCRWLWPRQGPWRPASRWWHGNAPEWDLVASSLDGDRLLLGEVKWSARPFSAAALEKARREVATRPAPRLSGKWEDLPQQRALFVPALAEGVPSDGGPVAVYSLQDLLLS